MRPLPGVDFYAHEEDQAAYYGTPEERNGDSALPTGYNSGRPLREGCVMETCKKYGCCCFAANCEYAVGDKS
jgi:hypothetical protein